MQPAAAAAAEAAVETGGPADYNVSIHGDEAISSQKNRSKEEEGCLLAGEGWAVW